jgi:hypothetical protein
MYSWNAYILKSLLGEEFTAAINRRYLKKYYPSFEVDHWLQAPGLQASKTQKQPTFGKEVVFGTEKNPNRGDGQYWSGLPLAQKMFYITNVSCRILFGDPATYDNNRVGSRRPGERSESMLYSFDSAFFLFSSSLFTCSRATVTTT